MKSLLTHPGSKRAFTGVSGRVATAKLILSRQDYISKMGSYHAQDA